ncbi:sigma-70 family RNA polymerase sigma factor [Paenibacillus filicis]|uniref:Sigma-70 family RNA polymerase sigma factor n=1 Tax=Paenibacillus filicis TaxID=669464 RepID=A0ABU9DHS0_9BACL
MGPKQQVETVSNLQLGDIEAFDILVNTYREQAQMWAIRIVRDSHLAEDVVQESFLQMKGKISNLQDPSKFNSWFRQLVRRIAINHIRGLSQSILPIGDIPETDVNTSRKTNAESDPLHQMLIHEKEQELLRSSLYSLSKQARSLLTSFALKDATPEELAIRFQMNKSNVYNILSRSRAKANDERFRCEVDQHIRERRRLGLPSSHQLQPPCYGRPYALISILIGEVLRMAGEPDWTLTNLMGISGDAFRLNVTNDCNWRSISTFDWSYSTYRTLERLGLSGTCFGRPGRTSISPEQQIDILSTIQDTIVRGLPVIIWNLEINEFGFVYGYNDEDRTISYFGYNRKIRKFRYEQLGRSGQEPALFIAAIRQRVASPVSENEILASIVNHAKGKEPPIPGFEYGLQGYRLWLEAVESERLDLHGHAYQVAILSEARHQGALYLQNLSERTNSSERQQRLAEAAACYRRVSDAFAQMYPSFPFGYGGSHADRFSIIRGGLLTAFEAEMEGISFLESLIH